MLAINSEARPGKRDLSLVHSGYIIHRLEGEYCRFQASAVHVTNLR